MHTGICNNYLRFMLATTSIHRENAAQCLLGDPCLPRLPFLFWSPSAWQLGPDESFSQGVIGFLEASCAGAGDQGLPGSGTSGTGIDHATARLAVQAAAGALMQMSNCTDIVMWYDTLPQVVMQISLC